MNLNKIIASWKYLYFNCLSDWEEFEDSCWKIFKEKVNWFQAEKNCKRIGGYLAELSNHEKNDIVIKYLSSNYFFPKSDEMVFWLGMKHRQWVLNGSPSFTDWFHGFPKSGYSGEPSDDGLRFVYN